MWGLQVTKRDFEEFFRTAAAMQADQSPFPYQRRLAQAAAWPARIEVPTGLGKTLAIVVAWLWRRQTDSGHAARTPRRLIYCLPMRVLVEQTRDVVGQVCARLGVNTRVVVLMGGVDDGRDWDTSPEQDAIIIGTQDMLLSRALNRGYGMSRYRWPLHYGLLNNDCQWVIDEPQLMGSGLATTAQLHALRRKLGTALPVHTSWMSATLDERWLQTVDIDEVDLVGHLTLDAEDHANPVVMQRVGAQKELHHARSHMGEAKGLAAEIVAEHRPGTRTLVIVNTVERAREIFGHVSRTKTQADCILIHSRFRAPERDAALRRATATPETFGTIVVSTQVVEAGVDLSSTTMFTELAPWSSLVQRFGRCNRKGEEDAARAFWVSLPEDEREQAKLDKPYELAQLTDSAKRLMTLADVGPASLPRVPLELARGLVLRRRDLVDLFDTTADLMGDDVDVSRFIRDADDHDVRVFWRDLTGEPARTEPSPGRAELCSVPVAEARSWLKRERAMWVWDGLEGRWTQARRVYPGLTLLLYAADGGYSATLGLDPKGTSFVQPVPTQVDDTEDRTYSGDPLSEWQQWYTLSEHSNDVAAESAMLAAVLGLSSALANALETAGRWHDAGKAHPVWQAAARRLGADPPEEPVAKSLAQGGRITYEGRRGFRHELASALMALQHGQSDLVAYLVACHHGKVRVSIRTLPFENAPRNERNEEDPTLRHARGIWEGDQIPAVDLGHDVRVPATTLSLRYMELGDDDETGRSWLSRVLALRDAPELGPLRLGFLEALIKCADERASRRAAGKIGS